MSAGRGSAPCAARSFCPAPWRRAAPCQAAAASARAAPWVCCTQGGGGWCCSGPGESFLENLKLLCRMFGRAGDSRGGGRRLHGEVSALTFVLGAGRASACCWHVWLLQLFAASYQFNQWLACRAWKQHVGAPFFPVPACQCWKRCLQALPCCFLSVVG